MNIPEPEETFVLEAKFHFKTREERKRFQDHLMEDDPVQPITMKLSNFFSHCKFCGRPKWMNTLGNGKPYPKDECKLSHSPSCNHWAKEGGWKPNAEMGS